MGIWRLEGKEKTGRTLTSFSFSSRSLISSSYLSSLVEYFQGHTYAISRSPPKILHFSSEPCRLLRILSPLITQPHPAWAHRPTPLQDPILTAPLPPSTLSAWASRDFKLLVTIFSSSSRSPHLLQGVCGRVRCEGTVRGDSGDGTVGEGWRREEKSKVVRVTADRAWKPHALLNPSR